MDAERRAPGPRVDAFLGLTLLLSVVVGLLVVFFDWDIGDAAEVSTPGSSSSSAAPPPEEPRVPDLSGLRLDAAERWLASMAEADDLDIPFPLSHDLSPRGRSQMDHENWTVVT